MKIDCATLLALTLFPQIERNAPDSRAQQILRGLGGCTVNNSQLPLILLFIHLPKYRKLSRSCPLAGATQGSFTPYLFGCAPRRDDLISGTARQLGHVVELEDE